MKIKMNSNKNHDNDISAREPLLSVSSPVMPHFGMGFASSTPKYSKLANQADSPTRSRIDFYDDSNMQMQEKMLMDQEEQLKVINDSVGSLKTVSKQICVEIDEQAIMLDDLNVEMENTDSKLDSSIKKVAKILHLNNDRRQWLAIGVLLFLLVIMLILYVSKF